MGFPNVDKFLVTAFLQKFQEVQLNTANAVNDLFEDLPPAERSEIIQYLDETVFTKSVQDRLEGTRHVYILPHFPVADIPFPQICVSLAEEGQSERFVGDNIGSGEAITDVHGNIIAWLVEKGYFANCSWQIDVVCATKDESIWLSRFCQLFICQSFDDLGAMNVLEIGLSLADLKLDNNSMVQPMAIFNRALRLTGKVANTWTKRVPNHSYRTGNNLALTGG